MHFTKTPTHEQPYEQSSPKKKRKKSKGKKSKSKSPPKKSQAQEERMQILDDAVEDRNQ